MSDTSLFAPVPLGKLTLLNRLVMAPMTRSRAAGNVPNALMAEYYAQRAGAGLIITEGTSPSPNGLGYARIPGLFSEEQVAGWKLVTDAVHAKGGHIFAQLMHTGRVGHPLNLPKGAELIAPSAVAAPGEMYTDQQGMQAHPVPRTMTEADLGKTRAEFVQAARNAVAAHFDGVELHGANGYLLEQFLSPNTNERRDAYGGSVERRMRFVLEVVHAVDDAIGGDKVGIRLSPYGANAGMTPYPEIDETYNLLVEKLVVTGIQYIHIVDHSAMGAPSVPEKLKHALRKAWPRTYVASGGFDRAKAEVALRERRADLIAFGRPFLSNPDLVTRLQKNLPLNPPDFSTFYTPGPKGYTDYPAAG
ncbi:MAG: alkene reductase [Deltaproteobacteria bacterium RIFOXYA12_FULL_58_15]|nr:MAG: alkene reductase [Deltaproteobacteria bacterium RIFOXYA12_FULL_58_15]